MKRQKLTPREKEILQMALNGTTVNQIAKKLGIAEKTVANHYQNMRQRFGVNKIGLVILEAVKQGWIGE